MRLLPVLTLLFVAASTASASAEAETGSYVWQESGNDLLRLNTETGETSICRQVSATLVCDPAVEARDAWQTEIDALTAERDALQSRVDALETQLAARDGEAPKGDTDTQQPELIDGEATMSERLQKVLDTSQVLLKRVMGLAVKLKEEWL